MIDDFVATRFCVKDLAAAVSGEEVSLPRRLGEGVEGCFCEDWVFVVGADEAAIVVEGKELLTSIRVRSREREWKREEEE